MALQLITKELLSASSNVLHLGRFSSTHAAHKFSHALQSSPTTNVTELDNGIKVVSEKTNSNATTVGVWLEAGPRYETKELNGITNFIENLVFKNTKSRNSKQIQKDVYQLGGSINSFTNRDSAGFYATVAPSDALKAVELLSDLLQNPVLSNEDIEATRKQVLKQLDQSDSNYEQVVLDYLHSVAYQQVSLSQSKYGTTDNIKRFTRSDIEKGFDLILKGPQIVIASSGNVDHDQFTKQVSQSFKSVKNTFELNGVPDLPGSRYTGSDIRVRDDSMPVAHVAMAVEGPGYNHPDYLAMEIASSLLGKWDISHGGGINVSSYIGMVSAADHLTQSFQAFNLGYKDTGLWGAYFVGERMQLEETLWQLKYQWKRLCIEVTNNELAQGKNNLLSKLVAQREGSANNANSLALDFLRYGKRVRLEDWERKIKEVDSKNVHKVAENFIWDRCPVVSGLGPVENLPLYEDIRMSMSWTRY